MKTADREDMKRIMKTIAMAVIISIAACSNAWAQGKVKELDYESFNRLVYDMGADGLTYLGSKPAIIDFTATWCGPCRRMAPVLESIAKEYDGKIVIYKIDVDKEKDLARAFNISSIPALLYIPAKSGEPVMKVGLKDADRIRSEIREVLNVK